MVNAPATSWYQQNSGILAPTYYQQLDTCVRALCAANSVTAPTANWYSSYSGGTLVSQWLSQIDTAVRALCAIIPTTLPPELPTQQNTGQYFSKYMADLDVCVRSLCNGGAAIGPVSPLTVTNIGNYTTNPFGSGLIGYYDMYVRSSDKALFVSTQQRGSLCRFDASDPTNLTFVAESSRTFTTDGRYIATGDSGNTIYMATGSHNAVIKYDCTGGGAPLQTGILTDATNLRNVIGLVSKTANLAFACGIGASSSSGSGFLTSLDTSSTNPAVIQSVTNDPLIRNVQYITLCGNYVAITGPGGGGVGSVLTIWDISTPSAMTLVASRSYGYTGSVTACAWDSTLNLLYLTCLLTPRQRGLEILSLNPSTGALGVVFSGPLMPPLQGQLNSGAGVAQKMIKVGKYIWAGGQWGATGFANSGLWAIDVSNSNNPKVAYASAQLQVEGRPIFFVTGGTTLYEGEDTGAKLHTYTISPTT